MINQKEHNVVIPKESLRFRVIASSNQSQDQSLKIEVRDDIQKHLYSDLVRTDSLQNAKKTVEENMPHYQKIIEETLMRNHSNQEYTLNYGLNYFPEKVYKGVSYEEGYYESLVVTLGDGKGDNWWCVMFPPLCLLEAEESETKTEVEYKFFIQELINKYFK